MFCFPFAGAEQGMVMVWLYEGKQLVSSYSC